MPELPEVEVIVRGLQKKIIGKRILGVSLTLPKIVARGQQGFVKNLRGLEIKHISRRGKYIILGLSDDRALLFHLKLTGQLIVTEENKPVAPHTHLILTLSGASQLRLCDLRRFGRVYLIKINEMSRMKQLNRLGPEANEISKKDFLRIISKRKGRIKSLLLNQEILAGLGNIYSDEALHQAGIHPLEPVSEIPYEKLEKLHQRIRKILTSAIACGGSTVENYLDSEGKPGRYQKRHRVYGREGQPCLVCRSPISRIKIGNRSSYFCPLCQKRPDGKKIRKAVC